MVSHTLSHAVTEWHGFRVKYELTFLRQCIQPKSNIIVFVFKANQQAKHNDNNVNHNDNKTTTNINI